MPDRSVIRADFDRIAQLEGEEWNHNRAYHALLLNQLPAHCGVSLEIGCGTGEFARLLARRSDRVVGLDLSPMMIRLAKERSRHFPNIDFQVADVMVWDFPQAQFDCVASIATLHHLPLELLLTQMKRALKAQGILIILDLVKDETLIDYLSSGVAMPLDRLLRLVHNKHRKPLPQLQAAWAEHGKNDVYLALSQVRQTCQTILPGAKVRRHLFWRYSITWIKPN